MFRTKKDVDRHVQNIFSKLRNENEKNLRCYNVAKLYYQVGDYESARRYVSSYLEVRDGFAGAHKLLGQAYEALGQKEAAFNEYKTSLELEGRQDDLVLRVCELLIDMDIGMDVNKIRYWVERADKQFPHHPVVFQLKEKLLTVERPNNNCEDLEALIASELTARPTDVQLRVKLLKHYMSKQKFDNAYDHAASVEATHSHRNSIVWYQTLCELLTKCKETKYSDWSFWILYISALERYAALCLKEQGSEIKKSVPEATQAVFNFDQSLNEMKLKNFSKHNVFTEHMLTHMWGQLHFHLACLVLRKAKREQGSWSEAGRLCAPLLLTALHVAPMDPTATWAVHVKDNSKNQINLWHKEGSYRCSQTGHVLQDYGRDDTKKLIDKIDKFCTGQWRERIYQRIFVSRIHLDHTRNSYFCNHSVSNAPLRLCSQNELKHYDEAAERMWPDSLHHQVWLGIKSRSHNLQNKDGGLQPHQYSHIFSELQFSMHNISQAAPDSLSQLDIDAFLNAAILCSTAIVEEHQFGNFLSPERWPTLPADLTPMLCTYNQEKWWSAAYKMYSKQKNLDDIGEIRQELQQGLEVVRCIGNHGLHPVLLVHLARIFHYRAKMLKEKDKEHGDILSLEARSELYWTTAIPLLERLQNNQTIRMSTSKLFSYQGKEMNNVELTNALEEGKLLLAQRFVRDKQFEPAIDALQALKCPEASFQQAQIYKMFADEIVNSMPRESLTSEMRSQHIIMLSKARNCFYLTLDRLRSPGINPKHPLNSELSNHIADIENELKRIDPDLGRGDLSRNDCDNISDESYSPAHSAVDQTVANPALPTLTALTTSNILSTPQRNTHRTPKQTSTPCRPVHILDLTRNRTEARPSPERLDAQIRQIMQSRDNEMQDLVEQMKNMMDHIKTLTEKVDDLMKEVTESRKENQKNQRTQQVNINTNVEDDFYVIGDDEYADLNYQNQSAQASSISGNMFTPPQRHPYSPLVYPSASAFQGYYQGGIPFNDPNAQAIPSLYPHNVYPMPVLYPSRSKVPDNLLQQSLFTSRLPPQLTDLIPPANPPLQMSLQKIQPTESEKVIKDAPVNKVPPVNVVITSSDTLPTPTTPFVQPTLSVIIPPQYRLGGTSTQMPTEPISSNPPHCYQISMPSQATIPTTVNLPPLSATITTTPANITVPDINQSPNDISNNIYTNESLNTSTEVCETEHDPIPDFVPVIPLPAEVKVTTGEEDETTLYCARAKLFRFVDKEWKERGVGYVKLLKNAEGKVRLLMRRDQVLKICANHMLRPDMELTSMVNNNKAWCWVANDFADEQVKLEKLCIKFKTVEEALSFKECFDKARLNLPSFSEPISQATNDKDTSKAQRPPNQQAKISSTTETVSTDKSKTGTTTLGGFSFTSKPIVQEVDKTEITTEFKKSEEVSKTSPFSGFSFTKSTAKLSEIPTKINTNAMSTSSTSFAFATTATPVTSLQSDLTNKNTIPNISQASDLGQTSAAQTALRRPRMPPPGAVKTGLSNNIPETEIQAQTANELKLFDTKAKEFEKISSQSSNENKNKNTSIDKSQPPLSELFKPPVGSWECSSCYTRNNAANVKCVACEAPSPLATSNKSSPVITTKSVDTTKAPLSELFKPPTGSWSCQGCYLVNSSTNVYCIACDKPKDSSQPPKPQISALPLNISSVTPMTTFSFGIPKDISKETTPGFSFRMPKAEDKTVDDTTKAVTSIPQTSIKSEDTGTSFVFGMPTKTSLNSGDVPFTFGSPTKTYDFHFTAKSPIKSPGGGGETSEEEVVESDDIHFSPIIPLPDKIEVKTGEEDEEVLYSHRAKLFRFDTNVKEWKERGLGDIKLLCHKETNKLRLIMRRDHTLKLCLNHLLSADLKFTSKDEKNWLWNAADYSEGEIEYMQFACRFKTSEIAKDFKKAIDDAIKCIELTSKIDKPSTKTQTKTTILSSQEIEILYETKVTPEEKAAALKLQLPENFYAYKQKEDCPGCRGCRKPNIVLYSDHVTQDLKSKNSNTIPEEKKLITLGSKSTTSKLPSSVISTSSSNDIVSTEASSITHPTVKNGFSFVKSPTTTFKASSMTTPSMFDGSTMSFGTGDMKLFNEKKSTTFSFGMHPQYSSNEETGEITSGKQNTLIPESLKICTPTNAQSSRTPGSSVAGSVGQSIFGDTTSTESIFKSSTFSFDAEKNIFGASKTSNSALSKTSPFGSSESNSLSFVNTFNTLKTTSTPSTTVNSTPKVSSTVQTTSLGTGSLLFGSGITQPNSKANETTSTITFDIANQPTNSIFVTSSMPFSKIIFDNTTSPFGNSMTTTKVTNMFDAKPLETPQENEDISTFFPANSMSFSALAAKATQQPAFKVDPNFSFAGAGTSVFGTKSIPSGSSTIAQNKSTRDNSMQKDDNEDDGEADNEQEHDPHFEPIVPLPDAIEVRTGEEDEEKVFCQRAKLYRYDHGTKEWKERGVGEMKILHHSIHGSYRLLLRRDLVHKVVCNFLLTPDVEFHPLSTSDQAWIWAGMNHAEQEPCVERLAVKFKSSELATQFKELIDKIQQTLREKENTQGERCVNEVEESEQEQDHDVNEDEEDEDYDGEEEDDSDQDMFPIVEKRATLFAKLSNETEWEIVGLGNLAIYYDSDIYAERIVLKADDSEEYVSNTIISMETVMQVEGKECIWTAIDYAMDPPVRRILRAVFSSVQAAEEMHTFFEDGLDCAKQAGVVEYHE